MAGEAHVEEGALEPGGLGEDGDDGCACEGIGEGLVRRVGVGRDVAFGRAGALDLGHEGGGSGLEARDEGDEGRGEVEGEVGVEVGLGGAGEGPGMLDVLEALCVDAFEDAGDLIFQLGRVLDARDEGVVGERRERIVEDECVRVFLPRATFEAEEVAEEGVAALGEDALGVVLDSFEDELTVADAHDDAALFGDASDHELLGESFEGSAKGVVARRKNALGYVLEAAAAVVSDGTELAMLDLACVAIVG